MVRHASRTNAYNDEVVLPAATESKRCDCDVRPRQSTWLLSLTSELCFPIVLASRRRLVLHMIDWLSRLIRTSALRATMIWSWSSHQICTLQVQCCNQHVLA
jgi:hypothetical protein